MELRQYFRPGDFERNLITIELVDMPRPVLVTTMHINWSYRRMQKHLKSVINRPRFAVNGGDKTKSMICKMDKDFIRNRITVIIIQ